jgi:glyoxalase superfamily protein
MTGHRSLGQFVLDVHDLDHGSGLVGRPGRRRGATVRAAPLQLPTAPAPGCRDPGLFQRTDDDKVAKERIHLDLETDDVEAEVRRLEGLGATRDDHQQERGVDFWVLRDPWGNQFCVLHPNLPELLTPRRP